MEMSKCHVPMIKTSLDLGKVRQQVSPLSRVNRTLMRQGRLETPPRFLKCCGFKCALAYQRQPADKSLLVSERSCLEKMVNDFPSALVDGGRIKTLYRICHIGV